MRKAVLYSKEFELIHEPFMKKGYLLLGIVSLMSIGANLPADLSALSGVDRKFLMIGLLLVVTIALVRYTKFALVLAVGILAVGANLPLEIARSLNIDPRILMLTLAAIVIFSLVNRIFKLPSGLDKKQGFTHGEGSKALFAAIANGRIDIASRLMKGGANVNGRSRQGYTALMIAASHGQDAVVRMLLGSGADLTTVDANGRNALQIAREADRKGCVAMLLAASKAEVSIARDAVMST